jgi:hypothetical protein
LVLERGCRFDQERGAKKSIAIYADKVCDGVLDPTDWDCDVSGNADRNAGIEEAFYAQSRPYQLSDHEAVDIAHHLILRARLREMRAHRVRVLAAFR